jgi:broad specificity phosphatase PhoE
MKPERIFIVRHGESQGNVDRSIYKDVPDYALQLTPNGVKQAISVGKELSVKIAPTYLDEEHQPVQFYVSPFWRTRQTYLNIAKSFPLKSIRYYEDSRLREQEWGQNMESREGYKQSIEESRDSYGHFYYRFRDGGESCADVYDRVSDFMGTMFRDFKKPNFPSDVVIVTHGMTMRLFLMRFFHASVEEFELWSNPKNCGYFLLEKGLDDKYVLRNKLKRHKLSHNFQFPISEEDKPYFHYPHKFEYDA